MDADAILDALVGRDLCVALDTIALWTSMGQFTASTTLLKLDDRAVAGALNHAAVMHCDGRVDQVAPQRP